MQFLSLSLLLSIAISGISSHPAEVVGRQPITPESATEIMASLKRQGLTIDDLIEKRDNSIRFEKRGGMSDESLNMLIETAKQNNVAFDFNRLDSRPPTDDAVKALVDALGSVGIKVDLNLLTRREAEANDIAARAWSGPTTFPDCDTDPANSGPYTGSYKIGQGEQVKKKDPNGVDACDTKGSKVWCWTEQWLVETAIEYENWTPSGFSIDCATTSSCSSTTVNLGQSCATHTDGHENGFELNVEAKFEFALMNNNKFQLGVSPKYTHKWISSDATTTCTSDSSQATCTWTDNNCHAVWSSQRNVRVYGYLQRTCEGDVPATVQQPKGTKNGAGDRTVLGIMDYSFTLPLDKHIGCAASCGDATYPNQVPVDQNPRMPFALGN